MVVNEYFLIVFGLLILISWGLIMYLAKKPAPENNLDEHVLNSREGSRVVESVSFKSTGFFDSGIYDDQ